MIKAHATNASNRDKIDTAFAENPKLANIYAVINDKGLLNILAL